MYTWHIKIGLKNVILDVVSSIRVNLAHQDWIKEWNVSGHCGHPGPSIALPEHEETHRGGDWLSPVMQTFYRHA